MALAERTQSSGISTETQPKTYFFRETSQYVKGKKFGVDSMRGGLVIDGRVVVIFSERFKDEQGEENYRLELFRLDGTELREHREETMSKFKHYRYRNLGNSWGFRIRANFKHPDGSGLTFQIDADGKPIVPVSRLGIKLPPISESAP